MAQQTIFIDDLDPSVQDATTRTIGLGGVTYEIDLGDANYEKLTSLMQPYLDVARRVGSVAAKPAKAAQSSNGRRSTASSNPADPKVVRAWALANGIEVNDRGRIPAGIFEQYEEAQSGGGEPTVRPQVSTVPRRAPRSGSTARKTAAKKAAKKAAPRKAAAKSAERVEEPAPA